MVLELVLLGRQSRFSTPLFPALLTGCIVTHGCLVLLDLFVRLWLHRPFWDLHMIFFHFRAFLFSVRGRPLPYGGSDDMWSGGLVGM